MEKGMENGKFYNKKTDEYSYPSNCVEFAIF